MVENPGSPRAGRLLVAAALTVFASSLLPADAPADEPATESSLTERIEVRRIEFSILAQDGEGKPVEGLTLDDVRVRLRGEEIEPVYLEPVIQTAETDEPLPQVRLRLEVGGVVENEVAEPDPPNYTLFFIDTERGPLPPGQDHVQHLTQFVQEAVKGQDLASVVSYGKTLRVETPFTSDKSALEQAIANAYENKRAGLISSRIRMERLTRNLEMCIGENEETGFASPGSLAQPGTTEPALMDPANLSPILGCVEMLAGSYMSEMLPYITSYLGALESTIQYGRGVNGPLTVYAISHGVTTDPLDAFYEAMTAVFGPNADAQEIKSRLPGTISFDRMLDEAITLAKRQRAAFFFIDPTLTPAGLAGARMRGFYQPTARPVEKAHESGRDLPRLVAAETGGVFMAERNVLGGLRRSHELQKGRYIMGIDARDVPGDGDLERIDIDARDRGIRISHSRGLYMDGRAGDALDGRIAVLPGPAEATVPELSRSTFAIGLDGTGLEYLSSGTDMETELTMHLTVQTMDGRHLVGLFHQLRHAVPRASWSAASRTRVVSVKGTLEAPPGAYRLLAFVRNPAADKEALIFREIEIPEVTESARAR